MQFCGASVQLQMKESNETRRKKCFGTVTMLLKQSTEEKHFFDFATPFRQKVFAAFTACCFLCTKFCMQLCS